MKSRTRLLLSCSLGALLLLIAGTGIAALAIFHRIRAGESGLRQRFFERSARLEQIRRSIYLSGTLARDYFAEPDGPEAAALMQRLERTEEESKSALEQTGPELRGEVIAYWKVLHLMAEMAQKRHGAGVDAYFRHQLALRRETMLHIAEGISATLAGEWQQGQREMAALYARFRLMFEVGLALVVAIGLAFAIAAIHRLMRLERAARSLAARLVQAEEQERRAIARELHDEIGQSLSGVMLDLGRGVQPEVVAASVERIVDEVRRIALSLRPSMLDDLGLVPALEWQAREVGGRTGLSVQIQAEESAGDLPEGHCTCIYRVVQEALQNSARHAGAKRVRIGLRKAAQSVSLEVQDDGKGFTVTRSRGLGLLGMEERVSQLGGSLRVQSEPGRGTTVTAELPI
jgi:signal transduction histidine kinase